MDPRQRFTATVEDYRRYRPDYPAALIDWVVADAALQPDDLVVDIGCGTGITSRLLADRGLSVVGVDPNEAMLAAARAAGGERIRYLQGDAESLPLGPPSEPPVDAIVGGQAFHWFDLDRALPRFRQLLRPGGRVVAFWNLRDLEEPMMAEYDRLLLAHCPDYAGVGAEPRARVFQSRTDLEDRREATFPHQQVVDGFMGRVWSSSYVKHGVVDEVSFDAALTDLFDRYAYKSDEGDRVAFIYRSLAIGFAP
jgi:SAM-dependent methyltransferase